MKYQEFLERKAFAPIVSGLTDVPKLYESMFPHQRDVCQWALRLGRAAAFLGTGMGKTLIELEWARVVWEHTGNPVLLLAHTSEQFPVSMWQKYASPIWMDINPSDTIQHRSAREHEDEKHICPLQLDVIRRGIMLWSNPGDLVWSPFAGIGSEGYVAIEQGRRFIGSELKRSYWNQACANLETAHHQSMTLFDETEPRTINGEEVILPAGSIMGSEFIDPMQRAR